MHKRSSFDHEKEVRAVVWYRDPGTENPNLLESYPPGIPVKLNLNKLIDRVIISPTAAKWFVETVKAVTKKYDFLFPVTPSNLSLSPYL